MNCKDDAESFWGVSPDSALRWTFFTRLGMTQALCLKPKLPRNNATDMQQSECTYFTQCPPGKDKLRVGVCLYGQLFYSLLRHNSILFQELGLCNGRAGMTLLITRNKISDQLKDAKGRQMDFKGHQSTTTGDIQ